MLTAPARWTNVRLVNGIVTAEKDWSALAEMLAAPLRDVRGKLSARKELQHLLFDALEDSFASISSADAPGLATAGVELVRAVRICTVDWDRLQRSFDRRRYVDELRGVAKGLIQLQ